MATAKKKPAAKKTKKAATAKKKKKASPVKRPSTRPKTASLRTTGKKAPAPAKKKTPAKKAKAPPVLELVERDRSRFLHDGEHFGTALIAIHNVGPLELPSGTIVTCDPFIVDGPPLARHVTPGSYPVSLAVATFGSNGKSADQRVAAATIHFRPGTPVRWEVATFDETPRKKGGEPGYPVDAGTACFMDAGAQAAIKAEPPIWPTASQKSLEQQLLTDNYVHTWSWAVYRPDPASKANCVAFMSGYGDGTYSSYWGLDERGTPVCLTTDFEVFSDEDWTAT
jgi:hypothetical protein